MRAQDAKVLIVGGGSMGGAIARGLVASGLCPAGHVTVADPSAACRDALVAEAGVNAVVDAAEALSEKPDVVLLAVKPQILAAVTAPFADKVGESLVVSIAAGVTLSTLEGIFGEGQRVVRVMPNLCAAVGKSASAVAPGSWASADDVALVSDLLGAVGSVAVLREDQLDAAGAVAGCAPAYFALMVDALTRAGVEAGLPAACARELVNTTMGGVSQMLADSGQHPRAYMERVTSPGGTTAAALHVMEPLMEEACYGAVDAALERTYELAAGSH